MITALKVEEAERIRDMADAANVTYSDLLANLIRVGLEHLDEIPAEMLPPKEEPLHLSVPA